MKHTWLHSALSVWCCRVLPNRWAADFLSMQDLFEVPRSACSESDSWREEVTCGWGQTATRSMKGDCKPGHPGWLTMLPVTVSAAQSVYHLPCLLTGWAYHNGPGQIRDGHLEGTDSCLYCHLPLWVQPHLYLPFNCQNHQHLSALISVILCEMESWQEMMDVLVK